MKRISTKNIATCGMLIAASFILANVKIMGSIAFDSLPAFVGGLLLGPVAGAIIGATAHLLTALLSGFPFTLPVHLIVAVMMAVTVASFTHTYRSVEKKYNPWLGMVAATVVGVLLNGPICIALLSQLLLPMMGKAGLLSLLAVLSAAACANIILAFAVYIAIYKIGKHRG